MPVFTIGIVRDWFYLLIFYCEKFSTWVWRLPFAVNVNCNLSNLSNDAGSRVSNTFFFYFFIFLFYFIITLGIHLQYSYTVLTYNKTTKFTYVTALLLTCLLLTYIKIPKTSLQQTKGLLKTINKWKEKKRKERERESDESEESDVCRLR